MHLLIPHASALSPACAQTLSDLALPNLTELLGRLDRQTSFDGDEYLLSPPHERALAAHLGLRGDDGALPWAARAAAADGIDVGDLAWGQLTPVHWQVGRDYVTLANPATLALAEAESRALFERVRELFESEGFTLRWGAPLRWYAAHDSLDGLPCASIDRVIGRNIDLWLQTDTARFPQAGLIRRLQNEVQMLLYTDPLTDQREAKGLPPVNSFWLSGCGRAQPVAEAAGLRIDDRLREPMLAENWEAWVEAWRALDAGPLGELLGALRRGDAGVALTLCGERSAQTLAAAPRNLWRRLQRHWQPVDAARWLEAL
ncbi:hypothetical protein [Piscinibacter sakaiensis]|uniref:hypothetical protein n=1 Tax=Piscinibacter sakaiensis TaxID=1547922 RepID=UPI003AAE8465